MLLALRQLMDGTQLDAQQAGKILKTTPEVALRYLKMLKKDVPGVVQEQVGPRFVFRFDPSTAFVKSVTKEEHVTLARVISASLGAAFSRLFSGTPYQVNLEHIRKEAVERLAAVRKQKYSAMNRKFVAICSLEASLGDLSGELDDILEAISRQRIIQFRYQKFGGQEDQRTLKPYSFIVHQAQFYVVGVELRDEQQSAPKTFRFARMRDVSMRDESFEYPELTEYDPDVMFRDSVGIFAGEYEPCKVVMRLSSTWTTYAKHHKWHSSQKTDVQSDGTVVLEFLVRPCREFEQLVLSFGEDAEVIEPETLRATICQRLKRASERYSEAGSP